MPTYSSYNSLGADIQTGEIDDDAITDAKIAVGVKANDQIIYPMDYSSIIAGTWQKVTDLVNNESIVINNDTGSPADGDCVRYQRFLTEGKYTISAVNYKAADQAIMDIEVGGSSIGTVDCYAAPDSPVRNDLNEVGANVAITSSAITNIDVKINGKNASATHYRLNFGFILIRRVSD